MCTLCLILAWLPLVITFLGRPPLSILVYVALVFPGTQCHCTWFCSFLGPLSLFEIIFIGLSQGWLWLKRYQQTQAKNAHFFNAIKRSKSLSAWRQLHKGEGRAAFFHWKSQPFKSPWLVVSADWGRDPLSLLSSRNSSILRVFIHPSLLFTDLQTRRSVCCKVSFPGERSPKQDGTSDVPESYIFIYLYDLSYFTWSLSLLPLAYKHHESRGMSVSSSSIFWAPRQDLAENGHLIYISSLPFSFPHLIAK